MCARARAVTIVGGAMVTCPKCAENVAAGATACPRCGLARDRFESFAAAAPEIEPELEALWQACRARWNDVAAHEQFLHAASQMDRYAYAARMYREAVRDDGDDKTTHPPREEARNAGDDIARRALDKLTRMVTARAFVAAPQPDAAEGKEPYRALVALLLLLLAVAAAVGIYALVRL